MAGSLTIDNINGKVISSSPVATESQVIGVGQTWQDVTASRVIGVTYTNATGKPIEVVVIDGAINGSVTINGIAVPISSGNGTAYGTLSFTIPNNNMYKLTANSILKWLELR